MTAILILLGIAAVAVAVLIVLDTSDWEDSHFGEHE